MADTIYVRARPELEGRTALWEKHPEHPGGEVFVQGSDVVEVARTAAVMERLSPSLERGGTLVRVEGGELDEALEAQKLREQQSATTRQLAATAAAPPATTEDIETLQKRNDDLSARIQELEDNFAQRVADALAQAPGAPTTEGRPELTTGGVQTVSPDETPGATAAQTNEAAAAKPDEGATGTGTGRGRSR